MENAIGSVVSFITDKVVGAAAAEINEKVIIPQKDRSAYDDLFQLLLRRYGNEVFYNDFDSFISGNHVVALLSSSLRGESNAQPIDKTSFINQNIEWFLNAYPKYSSQGVILNRISDAFGLIHDKVCENVLRINPYTDMGKLQNDFRRDSAERRTAEQETHQLLMQILKNQQASSPVFSNGGIADIATEELTHCSAAIETIKKQIKNVEENYQHKSLFSEALGQYLDILMSIASELQGQPQEQVNTLLCTLNCNIALCHSNLGNNEKAFSSLNKIPSTVTTNNKVYHCVFAIVAIQEKDPAILKEALLHAEKALALDCNYHKAFIIKQHLRSLLDEASTESIVEELDNHFVPLLSTIDQEKTAEYYLFRGIVNQHGGQFSDAIVDYEQALANNYDPIVGKLNLAIAKYHVSLTGIPRDRRVLIPEINMKPMLEAAELLLEVIKNVHGNPNAKQIEMHAVEHYVSACCFIGKPHELTPLSDYLSGSLNYECKRGIIMGSSEVLTADIVGLLSPEDALFCTTRELLRQNKVEECKHLLSDAVNRCDQSVSPPVFNLLLQVCLILKEHSDYWYFRVRAEEFDISSTLLSSYDAWAYDLAGETDRAKSIMDQVASSSLDDGLLVNALNFYNRNNFISEQEALFLRMHRLQKENCIYIVDLDDFYGRAMEFFVKHKKPFAAQLLTELPENSLSRCNYLKMCGLFYSEVNDLNKLIPCLSELWALEQKFTHGFDLALCLYRAMRYDEAIAVALKLEGNVQDNYKTKLYWLLSDLYMLQGNQNDSFSWAKMAHELTVQNPYDKSHQAYFSRAMACGHEEVLSTIQEYKHEHPVVVDWFHEISIPTDSNDLVAVLKEKLHEIDPEHSQHEDVEKLIADTYRNGFTPINLLFERYNSKLYEISRFASQNKLNIATGDASELKVSIPDELVTDAQTLIIAALFGGIEAIKLIPKLYISFGSIADLQQAYFINGSPCLQKLLSWIKNADNVTFVENGFVDPEDFLVSAFSGNFVACCNICRKKNIPYLYCDIVAPKLQRIADVGISKEIQFVSLPTLCFQLLEDKPQELSTTLYGLLKYCKFVSFTADTIVQTIVSNGYNVTLELLSPFMCCSTDCDMASFVSVYIKAIHVLSLSNSDAAVQLAVIVLKNTKQIWRRGTYYRIASEEYKDALSKAKASSIKQYVRSITKGINQVFTNPPPEIATLISEISTSVS